MSGHVQKNCPLEGLEGWTITEVPKDHPKYADCKAENMLIMS